LIPSQRERQRTFEYEKIEKEAEAKKAQEIRELEERLEVCCDPPLLIRGYPDATTEGKEA